MRAYVAQSPYDSDLEQTSLGKRPTTKYVLSGSLSTKLIGGSSSRSTGNPRSSRANGRTASTSQSLPHKPRSSTRLVLTRHSMLNDKRGPIGRALQGIRPEHRELWFIFGQLSESPASNTPYFASRWRSRSRLVVYSIIFMVPPAALFIHSLTASSAFLIIIFTVSAWNGASFYVEVFGRK